MSSLTLTIMEVLDNLNVIAEATSLDEIEVTEDAHFIPHSFRYKTEKSEDEGASYWIPAGPDEQTIAAVKKTFRSVHEYLRHSYKKMEKGHDPLRVIEGINTIMVLVGEAAKKLESFGLIFRKKISELDEYQDLQNFYRNTIIKGSFKKYAKELVESDKKTRHEVEEVGGVHLLNDLDVVKKDQLYDLFYIKNEAGYPFYTQELSRKIKLACDFGEFAQQFFVEDPLLQVMNWKDKMVNIVARNILANVKKKIVKFYKEAAHHKEMPMVVTLNNAIMALMLASNSRNLIRQFAPKGCHLYFIDFQNFLHELIISRDFQKNNIYLPEEPFFTNLLELGQDLCYQLYNIRQSNDELMHALVELSEQESLSEKSKFSEILQKSYDKLAEALHRHPSGPIFKALDLIREEKMAIFDPLLEGNLPDLQAMLTSEDKEISILRMACPCFQEIINRAYITEEFKSYLRRAVFNKEGFHHLIINFQDRSSWKEFARVKALEELESQAEFSDILTIVTFATDTEFYLQTGIYQELNSAKTFIDHLKQHLFDVSAGFVIPKEIKGKSFEKFMDQLFVKIHKNFFNNQDILSIDDRKCFIELVYAFMELKILELTNSTTLSLVTKDGLDLSATATLSLFALLLLDKKEKILKKQIPHLFNILFGPTLMVRERLVHHARFERLLLFVRFLEKEKGYLKFFEDLFSSQILALKLQFPE